MNEDLRKNVQNSAKGSLILLIGQVLSTVLSAFGIILVARILGATSFGVVSVALVPLGFASIISDWGVSSALTKYLSQYRHEDKPENRRLLIESALIMNTIIGIALSFALYLSSSYIAQNLFKQPEIEILIKYSSLSLIGTSFLRTSWAVAVGYERMELRIGTTIIYSLLKSIVGPVLVYLGYGPVGAILGGSTPVLFSGMIGLVIIWTLWRSETPIKPSMNHIEGMQFLLQYGYPLFLSALIAGVIPSITSFLLALNVSNELIGNYNAGIRFSTLIAFFSMPIATVMFPLFSKLENDYIALKTVYQNSVKFTAIVILPVAMVITALADQIVTVIYDTGYEQTPLFMKIYLLIFILNGFGGINTGNLLNGLQETRVNLHASIVGFLTTIPLSFILIPRIGVIGLMTASILGSTIGLAYRLNWVQSNLKFTILWGTSTKTLIASAAAYLATTLFVSLIQTNPWIQLTLGGLLYLATYFTAIITLKILTPTDLNYMETIFSSLGPFSNVFLMILRVIGKLSGYQ
jgi:stage V sporulation protein B